MPVLLPWIINRKKSRNRVRTHTRDNDKACKPDLDSKVISVRTKNGKGELIKEHGVNILRLQGTQFEMGYQHGYLLADQMQKPVGDPPHNMYQFWSEYLKTEYCDSLAPGVGWFVEKMCASYTEQAIIADRITDTIFRSLAGLVAGYRRGLDDRIERGMKFSDYRIDLSTIIKGYIQPDMCNIFVNDTIGGAIKVFDLIQNEAIRKLLDAYFLQHTGLFLPGEPIGALGCTSMAVLPEKTKDNNLLFGCNFDYDPLAGLWEKNPTLIHLDPLPEDERGFYDDELEKPQKYFCATSAGTHTAGLMGVNESGVAYRVHNNFSGITDLDFKDIDPDPKSYHGQPVLNFGNEILRHAKDVVSDEKNLEKIIQNTIKDIVIDQVDGKKVSDTPASGWTFFVTQMKDNNNSIAIVRETNYETHYTNYIPAPLIKKSRKKNFNLPRFAILEGLPEIDSGEDIQAIWQTNFYTNPHLREKDIFDRRANEFNRLNRFLRVGVMIRDRYKKGKFVWEDMAEMMADDRDLLSGDNRRINADTISQLSTVTGIIYSIKNPDNTEKPEIDIYLAVRKDKRTPLSWGEYYKINFKDLSSGNAANSYLKHTKFRPVKTNSVHYRAMQQLYDAYCYNQFSEAKKLDYCKLLNMILEVKKILEEGRSRYLDPLIDHVIGRIYCNLGNTEKSIEHLKESISNSKYIYDPHLITVSLLYLARIGKSFPRGSDEWSMAEEIINQLRQNEIYYENLDMKPYIKNALQSFIKPASITDDDKLKYIRDTRLKDMIDIISRVDEYSLKYIEGSITLDGPEPMLYDYHGKDDD